MIQFDKLPRELGTTLLLGLGTIALPSLSVPTHAQVGALEEVIVTATKTGETDLQSTPMAISSFSDEYIRARGINDVIDLANFTPGLQISDLNGYAQLYMRGVGSNNVFIGSDPSTTLHLDGVYLARPIGYFSEFLDIERVEVLRGPQGTLYGRNSVGGTVNIISKKPTETFSGEIRGTLGNYRQRNLEAYVSGPIVDQKVYGSLAYGRWRRNGYLDNVAGPDFEDQNAYAVRGQLYFPINDQFDVTLRADYHDANENKAGPSKLLEPIGSPLEDAILKKHWKVAANSPNKRKLKSRGVAAEINYHFTEEIHLKSLTAYRELENENRTDADATSQDIMRSNFDLDQRQLSQEFNLAVNLDRLALVSGLYYFKEVDREPADILMPIPGFAHFQRPKLTAESYAAFFQGEYWLTDEWSLIAGARWTTERKGYSIDDFWTHSSSTDPNQAFNSPVVTGQAPFFSDPFAISSSKRYNAWTPKVGMQYQPRDALMLYASATRGFKSGGFDFGSSSPEDQERGYGPEYLWSYEIGMKSQWLDDRLRLNASAFQYDYKDLQVTLYKPPINAITENAATARVKGIEIELTGRPHPQLDLMANIAYLDARYRKYKGAESRAFGDFDASGQKLNNAPRWATMLGARYTWMTSMGSFYVAADAHYRSTQYFTPVNQGLYGVSDYPAQQGEYTLVHARVGWHSLDDSWHAALVGHNLTREEYITAAVDYGGLASDTVIGRPGAPRMLSIQLSRSW